LEQILDPAAKAKQKKKTGGQSPSKGAQGLVSSVDGARVVGWAHDPLDDGAQTTVEFLLGDAVIASKTVSLQRMFLIEKGIPPNSGFSVTLPLPPGTHTISARTKRSRVELRNSPFTCTVTTQRGRPMIGAPEISFRETAKQSTETLTQDNEAGPPEIAIPASAAARYNQPAGDFPERSNIEIVFQSDSGAIFTLGWAIADSGAIRKLTLKTGAGEVQLAGTQLGRSRRRDVEKAVSDAPRHQHFGLCGLKRPDSGALMAPKSGHLCMATIELENGGSRSQELEVRSVEDAAFLETALNSFSALEFYGNRVVESFRALDGGLGDEFIQVHAAHARRMAASHTCTRFGSARKTPRASIIVCLYGKPEYLFLQNATFGMSRSVADFEFIYVSNSPELIDTLHKTAAISERAYGVSQTIVSLPGNAGFGAANNIAASYARSDRLLFVNPDVFPRDDSWGDVHQAILDAKPESQTTLFGARLFYADGSLMHGGMYLDADTGISLTGDRIQQRPMLRVEHFGKGAPPGLARFRGSRPVPAISGAFMSVDRDWFESLNGFSDDYLFGHYEDADLCLRSMEEGIVPYVHDLDFWHLEGKGSTRLPYHEAASTINRWNFTRTWHEKVTSGIFGKNEQEGMDDEDPDGDGGIN
jgi:GT2 family glycosyltransferase